MSLLAFKMLFRKKGTSSTVLAVALLVALIASTNSVVNSINSQAYALSQFARIGNAYLIISRNATSTFDSQVDAKLANLINSTGDVEYVLPQKLSEATLATSSGNYTAVIRGVDDIQAFLNVRTASVQGSVGVNETQANVGEILAKLASINATDEVSLTVGSNSLKVEVAGIVVTEAQSDTELIIPMKTADLLSGKDGVVSFIEFAPKDSNVENQVINRVSQLLPADARVVKVQQLQTFAQDMSGQTLSILNLWSFAVYAVVVATSYVVANRLVAEVSFELAMLRTLGAKRRFAFRLVLTHTSTVAFFGSILGLALGIAGAQTVSTLVNWMWPHVPITPFLEVVQVLQIILLAFVSSVIGCIYPALKSTYKTSAELSL